MRVTPLAAAEEAAAFLGSVTEPPQICVVLGSGLGALADQLVDPVVIDYGQIPYFHRVTVAGHAGHLVVGRLSDGGTRIAALAGRVHLYEGHPIAEVVHGMRAMARWGVKATLVTNAAGAVNPTYAPGELMAITDHINMTGRNPLVGVNEDGLGVRFPDMSTAYTPAFVKLFAAVAAEQGTILRQGVYAGMMGPSYETPAEVRMLGRMGADAVGMSTVNEVIAARHVGLAIAGISCITNMGAGLSADALDHAEVKEVALRARSAFLALVGAGLTRMDAALSAS